MPIDAAIPLQVRPAAPIDPMSALAQVMQLKHLQQQGEVQQQQARLRDQQLQAGQLEIAAKQRTQAGQAALAAAIKDPTNRAPDGAVNHEQIASRLSEQFPDVAEAWLAQTSKNADALDKLQSTKRAHAEAAQEAIGSLAASASNEREFEASLGLLASQGVLDEATATKVAQQASDAGPEGWKAIRDQYVHLAPSSRKAALSANAELTKPQKLSPGQVFGVPGQPPMMSAPENPTAAALDARAQELYKKQALKFPMTPEEKAELAAFEQRKTVVTDAAATAATNRATATKSREIDLLQRREDFAMQQAGRKELTDKVETPYLQARQSAQELRDTIEAAKAGNMTAAQQQALQTTMASIRSQGLNRINLAEIKNTERAGNLWTNIQADFGKAISGQPMPAKLQQDTLEFADLLEKGAYEKYQQGHKQITTRYKLGEEKTLDWPAKKAAAANVPENVTATLKGQKPGRYTLSDGSVWVLAPNGLIAPGK